ncbi:IclR family transcriptional regulator C-terminal domain-containing protein [Streptomyces sp. NPDC021356]|uniref:IclR family transcriptional regulator domain-containing protein n=1 Tax=Streptomyces sp. NPDC021356 TaxID=3154900 RepID=UPI0033DEA709
MSPSTLERTTGLARSTVDRVTATLARMGYVRLDGRDAVLTLRLMELGNAYLAALRRPALLNARADALADALDESVSLAVRDRDGIHFVHQATRRRAMSLGFRIGELLPAERTAPGPLFATEWTDEDWRHWHERRPADPENRSFPAVPPAPPAPAGDFEERTPRAAREGWASDDQLIEPGLVAVSVPVRYPADGTIACVASVVSHTSRHSAEDLRTTLLVGTRLPAHATALGRAPTAADPLGSALADEELEEGLRPIAVPLLDRTGRRVAAVNIAMHAARHTREECTDTLLAALRHTATRIEADLHMASHFTRVPLT